MSEGVETATRDMVHLEAESHAVNEPTELEDGWVICLPKPPMPLEKQCKMDISEVKDTILTMKSRWANNHSPWKVNYPQPGKPCDATFTLAILSPQAQDQFPHLVEEYLCKCREMDTIYDAWQKAYEM